MVDQSTIPSELRCLVVTPEATVLSTEADFVTLPLFDGECGIAPQHSPMIGHLGFGELRIRRGKEESRYYVDGGFVQVVDNIVSVLTNRAVPAGDLDTAVASELLRTALERQAAGPEQLAVRDRLVAQARGQLRVADRAR